MIKRTLAPVVLGLGMLSAAVVGSANAAHAAFQPVRPAIAAHNFGVKPNVISRMVVLASRGWVVILVSPERSAHSPQQTQALARSTFDN